MLRKVLFPAVLLLGALSSLSAQAPTSLPPDVRVGTLDNGIRYFIWKNAKPENRVELRLSVQAGSVQESDAERGLAHLVEHLQFEGTDRFGPQQIIQFLESNGMKFGNDLNAQTNFNDTQYFLDLPADQPAVLTTGLQILEDWAHGPKFTEEMLSKEKNIVAEEERVRMENVQGRLTKFFMPVLLQGTPYGERLPIGDMAVLKAVTLKGAQGFVQKWYTPRALSIQIVGDVDPVATEALLKATVTKPFANAGQPPEAPRVPPYAETSVHTFSDPEMGANVLVWNRVIPADPLDVRQSKQLDLLNFVVSFTLSKRFTELTQSADPPFLQASVNASPLFGTAWLNQFQVVVKDGVAERSIEAFLTELRRLQVHGVSATDLQLALGEYRSIVEAQYAQRANKTNSERGSVLAAAALTGEPLLSDDDDHRLRLATANETNLEAENASLPFWLGLDASRLLVLTTGRADAGVPDANAVLALASKVAGQQVDQGQERVVRPLFTSTPKPGRVTKAEKVAGTPLTKWTLSNGLVVWLYPNAFTKNEVQVRAWARGGLSRVSDKEYLASAFAPYVFANTGLGDLSLPELTDFLTGHQAGANASVDDQGAWVTGSAVPADLEVLFQVLNKKFQPPRRDAAAEASFLQQVEQSLKNQQDLPQQAYQNEIQRVLNSDAPRSRPMTAQRMSEVAPDVGARAYAAAFAGAPGYSFVITGDVDEAALKPLVETYLASLPGGKATDTKDGGIRPLKGPLTSVVKKGVDNKAVVTVFLPVNQAYSTAARLTATVLQEVLDIRLREVVRQDKEGTYGVSVDVSITPLPYPHALTQINFTCDRNRQDELLAAVLGELKALSTGTLGDEVFAKALEIRKKGLETDQKVNGWWAWAVSSALFQGDDLKSLDTLPTFFAGLKKEAVVAQARALLNPAAALTVILNPEEGTQP